MLLGFNGPVTGTKKKLDLTGEIVTGYAASSIPLPYLSPNDFCLIHVWSTLIPTNVSYTQPAWPVSLTLSNGSTFNLFVASTFQNNMSFGTLRLNDNFPNFDTWRTVVTRTYGLIYNSNELAARPTHLNFEAQSSTENLSYTCCVILALRNVNIYKSANTNATNIWLSDYNLNGNNKNYNQAILFQNYRTNSGPVTSPTRSVTQMGNDPAGVKKILVSTALENSASNIISDPYRVTPGITDPLVVKYNGQFGSFGVSMVVSRVEEVVSGQYGQWNHNYSVGSSTKMDWFWLFNLNE